VNRLPDIASVCVAVVVVLGAIAGLVAWFYKRGGQEQAFADALDRNTQSADKLTAGLSDLKTVVIDMFHDLDKRVTRLEDRAKDA
jgi:flagellar basal body-associated protein FliL